MPVLAMMIAPASRRFFVSVASYGGTRPSNASAPPVVGIVGRVDVVLERDRNAVQRSADAALRALAIERVGVGERVRVHRDRGVQLVLVGRDAGEVLLHDLVRRRAPGLHRRLHVGDAGLEDTERSGGFRRPRGRRLAGGEHDEGEKGCGVLHEHTA